MSKSHLFKVALSDFPLHGKVDVYEEGKAGFTNKLTRRETLATEKFRGLQGWLDLGSQLMESKLISYLQLLLSSVLIYSKAVSIWLALNFKKIFLF